MNRRVLLPLLAFSATLFSFPAVAETKVAVVDLQRALNEVADGRAAKAKLKKEFDVRQKELDDKQEELKKMQADLQAKGDAMSEDARHKAQQDMDQKLMDVSRLYAQLQKELTQKEHDATKGIFAKMVTIVKGIAEKEGVAMVFEKTDSGLFYAQPSLDLTNELIRTYNAGSNKGADSASAQ
ncbi:MAG TPA: OmpH family outer membrane protein [Myxococcales bacterium]|nr:OmpH family outer membrane protein [Myxococcales bacterium]